MTTKTSQTMYDLVATDGRVVATPVTNAEAENLIRLYSGRKGELSIRPIK